MREGSRKATGIAATREAKHSPRAGLCLQMRENIINVENYPQYFKSLKNDSPNHIGAELWCFLSFCIRNVSKWNSPSECNSEQYVF